MPYAMFFFAFAKFMANAKKTWHMHKIKIGDRTVLTAAASVMNW